MSSSLRLLLFLFCIAISGYIHAQDTLLNVSKPSIDTSSSHPFTNTHLRIEGDSLHAIRDTVLSMDSLVSKGKVDSVQLKKLRRHKPGTAVWMSAVLPGLGQAYNKKYWKIPIFYAGFAGLGYALYFYGNNFYAARGAYRLQVDGDPTTHGSFRNTDDVAYLKSYRDFYKTWVNNFALITVLWYAINLVDAAVDGHLYHYNMDDKLSLHVEPAITPLSIGGTGYAQASMGVKMTLRF